MSGPQITRAEPLTRAAAAVMVDHYRDVSRYLLSLSWQEGLPDSERAARRGKLQVRLAVARDQLRAHDADLCTAVQAECTAALDLAWSLQSADVINGVSTRRAHLYAAAWNATAARLAELPPS